MTRGLTPALSYLAFCRKDSEVCHRVRHIVVVVSTEDCSSRDRCYMRGDGDGGCDNLGYYGVLHTDVLAVRTFILVFTIALTENLSSDAGMDVRGGLI
jgi:hypothetical protein